MSAPLALVTGASRGIGKRFCIDLAKEGYDLVLAARSTSESPSKLPGTIDDTAEQVLAQGRRAMPVGLDVRDEEAIHKLAERVYAEYGRCDLLVNNAAIAVPGPALPDSSRRWRAGVDINVNGPFYLMQALCPRMAESGGRVVNISSAAAIWPQFGRPNYTVTKAALEALTQSLAHELGEALAVNCIRIDVAVWSEGFAYTLPPENMPQFEDPVVVSDALLWLAKQPLSVSGEIVTITELRERGIVRPRTPMQRA